MRILITGVAGLLGSNLARHFLDLGHDVIGIDNFSGGVRDFVDSRVQLFECDLLDTDAVDQAFRLLGHHGVVYHFAAYAAVGMSPFIRKFNYTNNLVATAQIINLCIKYHAQRLVFASSMDVYGSQPPPFTEELTPAPEDPYGIAKYACELDIKCAGEEYGLDWCIIRPHNVYGVNQNLWDPFRNVLGIWMWHILNKGHITVYGDGSQVRAFSYIDDMLDPLVQAGLSPDASKQIINLGGTEITTIDSAAQLIKDITQTDSPIVYLEPRREVHIAYPSYEKSQRLLGFRHTTNLRDGLTKMWDWARHQTPRPRLHYPCPLEIEDGLYSYWQR